VAIQPKPDYSFEDYLEAEHAATGAKHEYVAGQVFAMVGATYNHNLIATNLAGESRQKLETKPCTLLLRDMRLRIQEADTCVYGPDGPVRPAGLL